ncbi:MAG TPA: TetR/AcrR family transcriptional regulator [Iamia sp.]
MGDGLRDPTAGRAARRPPGRPARTSLDELVVAALDLGLDTFTLVAVAERVGVAESTVYGYVPTREALWSLAAARAFETLDVEAEADADGWEAYVDLVAGRTVELAQRHPGLREYLYAGPFEPSTVATFEALIARVRRWLPEVGDHLAFVLVSRPVIASLATIGDPVLEPVAPWLRRALIRGMAELLASEPPPPTPAASWRTKLRLR